MLKFKFLYLLYEKKGNLFFGSSDGYIVLWFDNATS